MALVTVAERVSGNNSTFTAPYFVTSDASDLLSATVSMQEAKDAALLLFVGQYGLAATDISAEQLSKHSWRCVCTYSPQQSEEQDPPQPPLPGVETSTYEFDFRAEPYTSKTSLEHIYHTAGAPVQLQGKLSVQEQTGINVIETVTIPVPPVTHRVTMIRRNAAITSRYIQDVEETYGHVNGSGYGHYGAGSLMLVEARGSPRTAIDWQIEFGFAFKPPRPQGTKIDGVTFAQAIKGHEHAWVYNRHAKVGAGGVNFLLPTGRFGYIERVWPVTSFTSLGIPALP